MNTESRTKNSMKNVLVGSGGQVLSIFLNFISRSIFIYFLGIEYLGINGLFTNILSILSLAELGIGNAIIYSMYKPIADNDKEKLKGLMNLYSTVYKIIGIVIAVIGICITPFLGFIIKNKPDIDNLTLIYLMFLANTVVSYFFSYKRSIITCDQRLYICLIYKYIFIIINGKRGFPFLSPAAIQLTDFLPHKFIERIDKAVLLKNRNEQHRRDESLFGMPPAHERLRADLRAVRVIELRLQPDLELSVAQRRIHLPDNLLLLQNRVAHKFVIGRAMRVVPPLDRLLGKRRAVLHRADRKRKVVDNIASDA